MRWAVVVQFRIEHGIEFAEELLRFGERFVHRDEPDVRDLVQFAQALGDEVAEEARRDDDGCPGSVLRTPLPRPDSSPLSRSRRAFRRRVRYPHVASRRLNDSMFPSRFFTWRESHSGRSIVVGESKRSALASAAVGPTSHRRSWMSIDSRRKLVPAIRAVHSCHSCTSYAVNPHMGSRAPSDRNIWCSVTGA